MSELVCIMRGNHLKLVMANSGCCLKTYRSKAKAKKAARIASVNLKPYVCPRCNKYHLTSK